MDPIKFMTKASSGRTKIVMVDDSLSEEISQENTNTPREEKITKVSGTGGLLRKKSAGKANTSRVSYVAKTSRVTRPSVEEKEPRELNIPVLLKGEYKRSFNLNGKKICKLYTEIGGRKESIRCEIIFTTSLIDKDKIRVIKTIYQGDTLTVDGEIVDANKTFAGIVKYFCDENKIKGKSKRRIVTVSYL